MARIILMTDFSEAYARRLLFGIASYAHSKGEAWSLSRLPTSIRDKFGLEYVLDYAERMKADAIIGQFLFSDNVSVFKNKGIIAIAQDFQRRFENIPNITGEYYKSGVAGAEYFLKRGFRSFAFYGPCDVVWSDERYEGFRDTIIRENKEFVINSLRSNHKEMWRYDFDELTSWLKSLPKPVAVMACDDNHAYYISEACHLLNINSKNGENMQIPKDIALLGVDNDEAICKLSSPNISSINQEVEKGGYEVARLIDNMISNPMVNWEDIVVCSSNIITRPSSDILVNEDPDMSKVLRFIHENMAMDISVDDIVAQVPMCRRLLEIKFRKEIGSSIYSYLTKARVERVAELLSAGYSVSAAAFELGCSDIKNLSRIFKRVMGMSPSEYRKRSFL